MALICWRCLFLMAQCLVAQNTCAFTGNIRGQRRLSMERLLVERFRACRSYDTNTSIAQTRSEITRETPFHCSQSAGVRHVLISRMPDTGTDQLPIESALRLRRRATSHIQSPIPIHLPMVLMPANSMVASVFLPALLPPDIRQCYTVEKAFRSPDYPLCSDASGSILLAARL
jgi:hypothetical protein